MEGNIIMDRDLKRSIILDNYQNPNMKHTSNEDYVKINTRNVSCIDNLDIYLKIEDNINLIFILIFILDKEFNPIVISSIPFIMADVKLLIFNIWQRRVLIIRKEVTVPDIIRRVLILFFILVVNTVIKLWLLLILDI